MIYLRTGESQKVNSPVHGACSNLIYLNTTLSASVGIVQSKLWDKGDHGRLEDNNALFLEERGNILHTLGLKVHNFMESQHG